MVKSLYDILEVSPRARKSVIESAYKVLVKETRADERAAREIAEAKEILLDKKKRAEYDSGKDNLT